MIKQLPVEFEFDFSCSRPQPNYDVLEKGFINRCTISFPQWNEGYYIEFKFYAYNELKSSLVFYDRDFGFHNELAVLNDCRGRSAEQMAESFLYKLLECEYPERESARYSCDVLWLIFNEFINFYNNFKNKKSLIKE